MDGAESAKDGGQGMPLVGMCVKEGLSSGSVLFLDLSCFSGEGFTRVFSNYWVP